MGILREQFGHKVVWLNGIEVLHSLRSFEIHGCTLSVVMDIRATAVTFTTYEDPFCLCAAGSQW